MGIVHVMHKDHQISRFLLKETQPLFFNILTCMKSPYGLCQCEQNSFKLLGSPHHYLNIYL